MTSPSVKTSIPETKTFLCSFSFLLFFLTVIQLLCFYSCYSLSPTPIINFYGSRLKDTKEFIIFLHSHTLLSRFLFTRDQDRIFPQQYQYNIKQKTHASEEKYHCRGLLSDPTSNSHNKYLRNFIENNRAKSRAKTPMVIPNSPDELP